MAKRSKSKKRQHEDLVKKLTGWYDNHRDYIDGNYETTWNNMWSLYNNKRVKEGYRGVSNTFVPMSFSMIETIVSSLGNGRPRLEFNKTSEDQTVEVETLNALVDRYWDKGGWDNTIIQWARSGLIFGTSILHVSWYLGAPRVETVPIRDFIIDPTAVDLDQAYYAGRSYLTTKKHLEEMKVLDLDNIDPITDEAPLIKRFKNLDNIPEYDTDSEAHESDKHYKEMFKGSTETSKGKNQIRVYEFYTDDKVYSIANRQTIIEERENTFKAQARLRGDKYPKGFKPYVGFFNYKDESLFYGKSEIEPIAQLQEQLNDLTNQLNDAISFANNPMMRVSKSRADLMQNGGMKIQPGLKIVADAGEVDIIGVESIPNDLFNQILNVKNEIREVASTPEITKGVGAQTGSQTATEIEAQLGNSGSRFEIKMREVEKGAFTDLAGMLLKIMQLFEDKQKMVRVSSSQGTTFDTFDPDTIQGEFDVSVTLESTAKANEENNKRELIDFMQIALQDPTNNILELKRAIYPKISNLDPDVINKIIGNGEAQDLLAGGQPAAPVPEQLSPEVLGGFSGL